MKMTNVHPKEFVEKDGRVLGMLLKHMTYTLASKYEIYTNARDVWQNIGEEYELKSKNQKTIKTFLRKKNALQHISNSESANHPYKAKGWNQLSISTQSSFQNQ